MPIPMPMPMHSTQRLAAVALLTITCGVVGACGGGSIDPCARFHAREQIPERHCPASPDAATTAHTTRTTHTERPTA